MELFPQQNSWAFTKSSDCQLAENLILVFGFYERQKRNKSEIVYKFVGIIVMITFI